MSTLRAAGALTTILALAGFNQASARMMETVDGAVLVENSPARPWVVVLPLAGRARVDGPLEVTPGVPAHLDLPADGDALLCGGADGCATSCRMAAPGDGLTRLPLVTGARVRGRCVVGRSPARGAHVFLRPAVLESRRPVALPLFRNGRGELVTNVLTDASGAFELEHVGPGRYIAEVHLRDGRIHESEMLVIEDEGDVHTAVVREFPLIRIPEGLRTVVTVRDRHGAPVAGAGVGLMQRRGDTVVFTAETVTDADGLAEVSGLVPDLPVYTTCSARGFARIEQRLPAPASIHNCVLERFATLTGSVVSSDGMPLAATVSLVRGGRTVEAGADGRFRLRGVPPGPDEMRIVADAYKVGLRGIVAEEGQDTDVGLIRLARADVFSGRAVDAESRMAVEGAAVRIVDPLRSAAVVSDQEGRFSLPVDLAYGARLEAAAAGYATATHHIPAGTAATAEGTVIPLQRPGALEVTVWSDDADVPCSGCTVTISAHGQSRSERTDGTGVARFANLAPGTYHVAREYVTAGAAIVHVSSGRTGRMAVVRPRETTRIELGSRSRSIEIAFSPQPAPDCRLSGIAADSMVLAERSADRGTYRLAIRTGETYRLQLTCGGGGLRVGTVPADFQGTLLSIPLGAGSVAGSIAAGGTPVAGREITLQSTVDGALVAWSVTQPDGRFTFLYLSPGTYSLFVSGAAEPLLVSVARALTDVGRIAVP